ncbi:MAG: hypothetical protein MET45_10230 [Nostoc sp. LLA-1]|nr:hypothetical protein [Cyanocohniella sp. LLY]
MTKIVISALHPNSVKTVIHILTPEQAENILGGGYPYSFHIMNVTDSITINPSGGDNTYEAVNHSTSYHDNKIHTVDYSRSIYNTVIY